jgi:dienelactone hydrolase
MEFITISFCSGVVVPDSESIAPDVRENFKRKAGKTWREGDITRWTGDLCGVGESTGNFAEATIHDFVSDARAAVEFLRTRNDIDPRRIGLVGHSEGGIVAPMAAVEGPGKVAFLVRRHRV